MTERYTDAQLADRGLLMELEDGSPVYNMGDGMIVFDQLDDTIQGTDEEKSIRAVLSRDDILKLAELLR